MNITLVIPTHNRSDLLELTLRSLALQKATAGFEVIVVDDGSSDGTRALVQQYIDEHPTWRYHYQDKSVSGAAMARNTGIRMADSPFVCLIDSGMILQEDFVQTYYRVLSETEIDVLIGRVLAFEVLLSDPVFEKYVDLGDLEKMVRTLRDLPTYQDFRETSYKNLGYTLQNAIAPWHYFWTCNVAFKLSPSGPRYQFSSDFEQVGMEDISFGYDLHKKGLKFELCLGAVAVHFPHETVESRERKWTQDRKNLAAFHSRERSPLSEIYRFGRDFYFNELLRSMSVNLKRQLSYDAIGIDLSLLFESQRSGLIVGFPAGARPLPRSELQIVEVGGDDVIGARGLCRERTIGFDLPFADRAFERSLLLDFWNHVSRKLLKRLVGESCRVAGTVWILTGILRGPSEIWAPSDPAILFEVLSELGVRQLESDRHQGEFLLKFVEVQLV